MLGLVLCLGGAVLAIPAAVLLVETLVAVWPARRPIRADAVEAAGAAPRAAVLIPAHDEASGIAETVGSMLPKLGPNVRLIVIADNCTDQTAALAGTAGAEVLERHDPDHRGKGFAIAFGLRHLDADPPEVVVLIDADCRISSGGIGLLAAAAARTGRPVQAEYLLGAPARPSPISVISTLAFLMRNRVRPLGLYRMGMPCQLTGSGMAFPWRVLRDAPETGSNLVEDLVMGIEMSLAGHPPTWCPQVRVSSELPQSRAAAAKQRRRWEHGQLHTLSQYAPRLLIAGVRGPSPGLAWLGLDLTVPPLALLVAAQTGWLAVCGLAAALGLAGRAPVGVAAAGLGAVGCAVALAWVRFGRATIPLRYLLFIPLYVLWKIPLYVSLVFRGKQATWDRTARDPAAGSAGDGVEARKPADTGLSHDPDSASTADLR